MGRPVTLLEKLCAHALKFGAQSIAVEYKDGGEWVFVPIDGTLVRVALFPSGGAEAKELRGNLVAAAERPVRTVIDGRVYIVKVRIFESFGENAFEASIVPAPKLDPSVPPSMTAKQAQYLAFIHNYTKIHRQSPAFSDMERYFQTSAPVVNGMIKTLERKGLIERIPGKARSIRVLVEPRHLPRLE